MGALMTVEPVLNYVHVRLKVDPCTKHCSLKRFISIEPLDLAPTSWASAKFFSLIRHIERWRKDAS